MPTSVVAQFADLLRVQKAGEPIEGAQIGAMLNPSSAFRETLFHPQLIQLPASGFSPSRSAKVSEVLLWWLSRLNQL